MDAVYPSMAATPLKDAGKTEARKRILDWFHASATVHDNPYGLPDSRIYH